MNLLWILPTLSILSGIGLVFAISQARKIDLGDETDQWLSFGKAVKKVNSK